MIPVTAGVIAVLSLLAELIVTTIAFRQARNKSALAESRFEDVRKLAHTFIFDVHDAIQKLSGSTPAHALIAIRARRISTGWPSPRIPPICAIRKPHCHTRSALSGCEEVTIR